MSLGWVAGSTLALILMNASVGHAQQDPQRAYEGARANEQQWQREWHEHLDTQERQQNEVFRDETRQHWQREERREEREDDGSEGDLD